MTQEQDGVISEKRTPELDIDKVIQPYLLNTSQYNVNFKQTVSQLVELSNTLLDKKMGRDNGRIDKSNSRAATGVATTSVTDGPPVAASLPVSSPSSPVKVDGSGDARKHSYRKSRQTCSLI